MNTKTSTLAKYPSKKPLKTEENSRLSYNYLNEKAKKYNFNVSDRYKPKSNPFNDNADSIKNIIEESFKKSAKKEEEKEIKRNKNLIKKTIRSIEE